MKTRALTPFLSFLFVPVFLFISCKNEIKTVPAKTMPKDTAIEKPVVQEIPKKEFTYHFISYRNKDKAIRDSARTFIKSLSKAEKEIVFRINRVDSRTYTRLDTIVIPDVFDTTEMAYSIFPAKLPVLHDIHKMIIFAYYNEAFGAYENGVLERTGPTSMGKKSTKTDTGLFFTNWKSKESVSTVDDSWILKWNFNISNHGGIGFHEYELPGHPASHSCLRLLSDDAQFLYSWANQWILSKGQLLAKGTPVLVYGAYPFGQGKPWWHLVTDPKSFDIAEDSLSNIIRPHLDKIREAQVQRDSVLAGMGK